jgi:hypothetical protein
MKFVPFLLLVFSLSAVSAEPPASAEPPKGVEQALRARVDEFYALIIQHKARAAEALVADDTKDYYYDSQKPNMESYVVEKIAWGPSFKTAEATINARMHMMFPGVGPQTVPMKFPSTWKIDNGKWCWYIDRSRLINGPFGKFQSAPGTADNSAPKRIVTPEMLQAGVKPEGYQIQLEITGQRTTSLKFTNSLPGPVTLQAPEVPGLKIEIAEPNIGGGKSTVVAFRHEPNNGAQPPLLTFTVAPTGQKIAIQVIYSVDNH